MLDGKVIQLGICVADLDAAMRHWGAVTGTKTFMRIDTDYEAEYQGRRVHVANRNAFAPWGDLMLELVEPGRHEGLAWDWLQERGEGIFHLGFAAEDMAQRFPGRAVAFEPLTGDPPHIVFLDTVAELGHYIELLPAATATSLMERVRATAVPA